MYESFLAVIATLYLLVVNFFTSEMVLVTPPIDQSTTTGLVVAVIDGDTIDVRLPGSTTKTRIRYIGIDTPEPYATRVPECGSSEATARNSKLVADQEITIVPGVDPYDKYDRLLAYVYSGDIFVNETLVEEGYGKVLMIEPNTRFEKKFITLSQNARANNIGIWAMCE